MRKLGLLVGLLAALQATIAQAYIGPGAGAGTIAIVLGILSSIFLAIVGVLWYPIKRLIKRRKASQQRSGGTNRDSKDEGPAPGEQS